MSLAFELSLPLTFVSTTHPNFYYQSWWVELQALISISSLFFENRTVFQVWNWSYLACLFQGVPFTCLMTFWLLSLPVCQQTAIHPFIRPSGLSLWVSHLWRSYSIVHRHFSLCLSSCLVTCRPWKLLALILYLSAVATVSGFPAPTNSFISDLQRQTWETLSSADTHMQKYSTHIHRAIFMCAAFLSRHKQVQLAHVHTCRNTCM